MTFSLKSDVVSSNQSGVGEIRKSIIEADLVDCMVALPGQLFYSTQIPAYLWFLARDKRGLPSPSGRGAGGEGRDRRGEILFIDARKMDRMVDRTHRELTDDDIKKIANTYHAWRGVGPHPASCHPLPVGEGRGEGVAVYRDIPGFCKSATLEEVRKHGYLLTPGRYVGTAKQEEDDEPFDQKMQRLVAQLREQQAEARRLDEAIWKNFKELGYGG
jgi:type I restriction enzyme M protein